MWYWFVTILNWKWTVELNIDSEYSLNDHCCDTPGEYRGRVTGVVRVSQLWLHLCDNVCVWQMWLLSSMSLTVAPEVWPLWKVVFWHKCWIKWRICERRFGGDLRLGDNGMCMCMIKLSICERGGWAWGRSRVGWGKNSAADQCDAAMRCTNPPWDMTGKQLSVDNRNKNNKPTPWWDMTGNNCH